MNCYNTIKHQGASFFTCGRSKGKKNELQYKEVLMNFRGRRNRRHFIHNACIQNSEQQEEQGTDTCHFDESVNFDRAAAILSGPIVDPDRLIPRDPE